MHRFHLPPDQCSGSILTLEGREAHHALRVLRIRPGDLVSVLDGAGQELGCEVDQVTRNTAQLAVRNRTATPPPPSQVTLVQAIPKGKLIDTIIQKATELGVHRVIPLLSEHVVSQLSPEKKESRVEHWRGVALEAIKQCGSTWLPKIDGPTDFQDLLANNEQFDLSLIASLHPGSQHPRSAFVAFQELHKKMPRSICVWIGPEGDFANSEVNDAISAGLLPISLGQLVLRCDTAAIYALSVINYELQAARP